MRIISCGPPKSKPWS